MPRSLKSTLPSAFRSDDSPDCTLRQSVVINLRSNRSTLLSWLKSPGGGLNSTGTHKLVPTTIEVVDIAGLVKGASEGAGLDSEVTARANENETIVFTGWITDRTEAAKVEQLYKK